MSISINLPTGAEQTLREAFGQALDRAALEALVIEGYRSGRLSIAQVGALLGFDNRWDSERWLDERGVTWNYSPADLAADRKTIQALFGDKT